MKKIVKKIICLVIVILLGISLIEEIYWFSNTQVKSKELVTNRNIPLYNISGLYVDSDENFYIGIDNYKWIEVFDKNGEFICSIGIKAIVDNFYVDEEGLLHIICTYRNDDKYYDQIVDIDKNIVISENVIKNNNLNYTNSINKFSANNRIYSIDNNIIKIEGQNYNKNVTLDSNVRWIRMLYDKINIIEVIIIIIAIIIIKRKYFKTENIQ